MRRYKNNKSIRWMLSALLFFHVFFVFSGSTVFYGAEEEEILNMEEQEIQQEELYEENQEDIVPEPEYFDELDVVEEELTDEYADEFADETVILEEIDSETEKKEDTGEILLLNEENVDFLSAEDEEAAKLLNKIEEGEIIALANLENTPQVMDRPMVLAAAPASYRLVNYGTVDVDEVSKVEGYREIIYIDADGRERSSPLYCMEAEKAGLQDTVLDNDAIQILNNALIRKILYFGYGGPGDISGSYDPTCSHIRWERWENRYIFTHMALSKLYSGQYGLSSEEEYEHAGVNRYINNIKARTIPSSDGIVFSSSDGNGGTTTGKSIVTNLRLFRKNPSDAYAWIDHSMAGFENGYQVTFLIKVTDTAKAGNSISLKRSETSRWQLGYWVSKSDFDARGEGNPRILKAGDTLTLHDGYYFRLVYPIDTAADLTYNYRMNLAPVSFLLVNGSIQSGTDYVQDFGCFVYQGERGTATLKVHPFTPGSLTIYKTDCRNQKAVSGALYGIFAADTIQEFTTIVYKKDEMITSGFTSPVDGHVTFSYLPPGKYYVKELTPAEGYLLDEEKHPITIKAGRNQMTVTNVPSLQAVIEIEKVDSETGECLKDAEFTIYEWNHNTNLYSVHSIMEYDENEEIYLSEILAYSEQNEGRYKISETNNPAGYEGTFQEILDISEYEPGEKIPFSFRVENQKITRPSAEIRKVDEKTGSVLTDAEFTLYEWNQATGDYQEEGICLIYDRRKERYCTGELLETETNQGKFKIKETRNPEGYSGDWETEIDLSSGKLLYQYTVKNKKEIDWSGNLYIYKYDDASKEPLKGAEFMLYSWDAGKKDYRKEGIPLESKETGVYQCENIEINEENEGRFKVIETKNPPGYSGEWEQELRFTQQKQSLVFDVMNTRLLGEIRIRKRIRESDILWAHGNPAFPFVIEGQDTMGIWHRYEGTAVFYPDNYAVDGDGYVSVQLIFPKIPLGNYRIQEARVLRYELSDVFAEMGNVVLQDASATVMLDDNNRIGAVGFQNEKSRFDRYSHTSYVNNTIHLTYTE